MTVRGQCLDQRFQISNHMRVFLNVTFPCNTVPSQVANGAGKRLAPWNRWSSRCSIACGIWTATVGSLGGRVRNRQRDHQGVVIALPFDGDEDRYVLALLAAPTLNNRVNI
jgi:hypothetical protein